jgi:ribonuclease Z
LTFQVTILGSGSASAHSGRYPSAQILNVDSDLYLIDCGEGTQYRMLENKIKSGKLKGIFISHLHGDHYFGLFGLLNSLSLGHRTEPIRLFGPAGLSDILTEIFKWSDTRLTYSLDFTEVDTRSNQVLLQEGRLTVENFPLNHRIPCSGFLFRYKNADRSIIPDKLTNDITYEQIKTLKQGMDVIDVDRRKIYKAEDYTYPPVHDRVYAYCSDTSFSPSLLPYIEGTTTLYHEATFLKNLSELAKKTFHSTAEQAAQMANLAKVQKLLIGHLSSRYPDFTLSLAEAKAIFPNSYIAEENATYDL